MRSPLLGLLCCTGGVAAMAAAAAGQTQLYLSEYQYQNARISAMGTDGSNPQVLFPLAPADWLPIGLTFDPAAQRFLWTDSAGSSEIYSADVNGANQATIYNPSGFCRGISRDAQGRVYFSSNNTVQRVNADGSGAVIIFTEPGDNPVGSPRVDATNGHVYVGAGGQIKRMDLDGSNVKTVVNGVSVPISIALDIGRGYIYWLDLDTQADFVGRARLDGSDFRVLIDNSPNVVQSGGLIDLLVDPVGGFLYYADELTGQVIRAGLDGQDPTPIYTTPEGAAPSGMVLSTGEPVQALRDCNGNGISDDIDIAGGAADCDNNGVPDSCQTDPCPQRTFVMDQGSDAINTFGRALGNPSQWQVFQPFDVPAEGWTVGEVGIDGYTVNYVDGSGVTVRLYPDDGTGIRPDETQAIASTPAFNLRFNTNLENWVYAPLSATLAPGRYWVRIEANNPTVYGGSINLGFNGLPSYSRGSSGNFSNPASPIALRLVLGNDCPADADGNGQVEPADVATFVSTWFISLQGGTLAGDFDGNGAVDPADVAAFVSAWFNALTSGGC